MLTFAELPIESKKALLEYCYMHCLTMADVENFYKDNLFSLEIISIEEAKRRCITQSEDWYAEESFEEYHKAYVGNGKDIPNHGDSVYPVIEGGFGEWLDDGWHRFHSYVKYGHKEVPVLKIIKEERD